MVVELKEMVVGMEEEGGGGVRVEGDGVWWR